MLGRSVVCSKRERVLGSWEGGVMCGVEMEEIGRGAYGNFLCRGRGLGVLVVVEDVHVGG